MLLTITDAPALAGDYATFRALGFSTDGRVFAYEEFGIGDGSGFPFASRYYINIESDTFLPGTPIRVGLDDEQAPLAAARAKAAELGQAATGINDSELENQPGELVAWSPLTELSASGNAVLFHPRTVVPPIDAPYALELTTTPFPAGEHCYGFRPEEAGFALLLHDPASARTKTLHRDQSVPKSRGCAFDYRLAGVITLHPDNAAPRMAAILQMQTLGFEGANTRWLAVTTILDR